MIPTLKTRLVIIGAGMAGLSAALFACRRMLSPVVLGGTSLLVHAAGPWDLLGVHPAAQRKLVADPFVGIETLRKDLPSHPYARVPESQLRAAFAILLDAFREAGYPYERFPDVSCEVVTSAGTIKRTYCLPHTMWAGAMALQRRDPCLVVGFDRLKDFSARQVVAVASSEWPKLRAIRIPFPGMEDLDEVTQEHLARRMDSVVVRRRLADALLPHAGRYEAVGVPPILGYHRTPEVVADLASWLGVPVFEIPCGPVSVPGIRIRNTFEAILRHRGARLLLGRKVEDAILHDDAFVLHVSGGPGEQPVRVEAEAVVVASGRFLGGGLDGSRGGIRETLFNLPVHQPASRSEWHGATLLTPSGHPVNRAGLEVDSFFRPLDQSGNPANARLFAAGSILAHQDWMREKSGSGLAMSTAYAAVEAAAGVLSSTSGAT